MYSFFRPVNPLKCKYLILDLYSWKVGKEKNQLMTTYIYIKYVTVLGKDVETVFLNYINEITVKLDQWQYRQSKVKLLNCPD